MSRSPEGRDRSKSAWAVLTAVLGLEAVGGLVLVFLTGSGMLQASEEPLGPRLSIFLAVLIGWVWVCATLLGGTRAKASWARGSALTIHVLLFAGATGMLQLGIGSAMLAWALVLLALIGFFAALMARPVYPDLEAEPES